MISAIDFIIGIVYLLLLAIFVSSRKKAFVKDIHEAKYFMRGFWFKISGVTFFALIYLFYYGGGDTLAYYDCCNRFVKLSSIDFDMAIKYLFSNSEYAYQRFWWFEYGQCNWIAKYNSRELIFIKVSTVFNLLSLNSYLALSYIYATLSFFASWKLYEVFKHSFPHLKEKILYASLFIPTVAFWGTGLMKDTFTYIALCYLIYYLFYAFILKKKVFINGIIALLFAYVISLFKPYILLAFLPAGITWIFLSYNYAIKSSFLRFLVAPFFILMSALTIFFMVKTISSSMDKFALDKIQETAEGFQRWHHAASQEGANYSLDFDGFSLSSLIKVFPQALNVTFFRPYLWEAKSAVVVISAIESTFFFLVFLYAVVIKARVIGLFRMLTAHPLIIMCVIFCLIFGYVVGLTSYNFGALSRYKIPAMPLFAILLVLISNHSNILKSKKDV